MNSLVFKSILNQYEPLCLYPTGTAYAREAVLVAEDNQPEIEGYVLSHFGPGVYANRIAIELRSLEDSHILYLAYWDASIVIGRKLEVLEGYDRNKTLYPINHILHIKSPIHAN